jgi:nickel/cobalt exporter
MAFGGFAGLLVGTVALGLIHGVEPGHGWPVAASYALDRANTWVYGFAASFILGVGHLISSVAVVAVFFYAKSSFDLTQVNQPIALAGVRLGGPVSLVAGMVLIALGIREYRHGHAHGISDGHEGHDHHEHGDDDHHEHGDDHHEHENGGLFARVVSVLPFAGGHEHDHSGADEVAERGLWGIAWFAFVLGFAHEEEFEIIALCAGSTHCLELMVAYALAVIVGIVGLTLVLIAGYERYEERVERYTDYLPAFSAAVLVVMGLGFITGLF